MTADAAFGRDLWELRPALMRQAQSLARDRMAAEDLVSEAMAKAWAARDRFEPGSNLRAWVGFILRNLFLSQYRRRKWDGGSVDEIAPSLIPLAPGSPELTTQLDDVLRALRLVPADQREALMLVAMGATYEEAADELVTSCGTIKSRVARGRAALEEALA